MRRWLHGFMAALALSASCSAAVAAEQLVSPPNLDPPAAGRQVAVLAGGCFWGMEAVFERLKGVDSVVSGYAGGARKDATYARVSSERTGHAEAVRISFDPKVISYGTLLRVYFSVAHDPTQLNRQGPDVGSSYRSAIFPQTEAQQRVARAYIAQLSSRRAFPKPIVTRMERGPFFAAEPYHQDFMRRNPRHPYILAHDVPKVRALRQLMPKLVKA
jgi:peptide-methionine (S)-S-oxide reductase